MDGLWTETIKENGESSIQDITPKVVKEFCAEDDHYFILESPSKREVKCKHCGMFRHFILGKHIPVDGKLVSVG